MNKKENMKLVKLTSICCVIFIATTVFAQKEESKVKPKNNRISQQEAELVRNHKADVASAQFRPGKGLEIKTADGRFSIITRLRVQFLYDYFRNYAEGNGDVQDFQLRRARLQFGGTMWSKHNKYKVEFAFSPRDSSLQPLTSEVAPNVVQTTPLLSWYMHFDYLRDATLRVGQYKIPYSRERVISSGNLQMIDRSLANAEFTLDRDIGFDIRSKDFLGLDMFKYYLGVYSGEGRNASNKTVGAGDLGLMYLARFEFLPLGIFKDDYSSGDFARSKPRLSFGATYSYLDNVARNKGIIGKTTLFPENVDASVNSKNASADVFFKMYGFSLHSEWFWREFTNITEGRNGWGAMLELGYIFPRSGLGIATRYGIIENNGSITNLNKKNEVGFALSYYFAHHNLKIQADVFRIYEPLKLKAGNDRIRIQMQTAF